MKLSLEKIKAMILYFAEHTDPKFFGKTKLMKLFYFADFGNVKKYGIPITFDQYKNMEYGPVPCSIYNLVNTAHSDPDESKLTDIIDFENSSSMHKIIPKQKFTNTHRKIFSVAELQILSEVCRRFYGANKKTIEDASHKEHPWSETNFLDDIPYTLATKDPDSAVSEEEVTLALEILN